MVAVTVQCGGVTGVATAACWFIGVIGAAAITVQSNGGHRRGQSSLLVQRGHRRDQSHQLAQRGTGTATVIVRSSGVTGVVAVTAQSNRITGAGRAA